MDKTEGSDVENTREGESKDMANGSAKKNWCKVSSKK